MEKLFWSIALPGFGQFLNGHLFKGFVLIALEFLVNAKAHFNMAILLSFHGDTQTAATTVDYGWLMFYPCLYFFAMWDAFRNSGRQISPYSFFPFAFSAFSVTVGLIFSNTFTIAGTFLGPVWFPMLCVLPGVGIGLLLKKFCTKWSSGV